MTGLREKGGEDGSFVNLQDYKIFTRCYTAPPPSATIVCRLWQCSGPAQGLVFLCHGFGEHLGWYQGLAVVGLPLSSSCPGPGGERTGGGWARPPGSWQESGSQGLCPEYRAGKVVSGQPVTKSTFLRSINPQVNRDQS